MSQPSALNMGSINSLRSCASLYWPDLYASPCCSKCSTRSEITDGAGTAERELDVSPVKIKLTGGESGRPDYRGAKVRAGWSLSNPGLFCSIAHYEVPMIRRAPAVRRK